MPDLVAGILPKPIGNQTKTSIFADFKNQDELHNFKINKKW